MFMAFVALFTVASLCCGLVSNIYLLIALRFIQALGGGGLVPSATGMVSDAFGRDRDTPIGLMSSIFPLGAIIGPVFGGVIVTYFSWRLIFFINVPVGLGLIGLLAWILPSSGSSRYSGQRVDLLGAALLACTLLALMLGISILGQDGWTSVLAWALVGVSPFVGLLFVLRQQRTSSPILPLSLIRQKAFAIVNGLNIFYGAAAFGVFSLVPVFAQTLYGVHPLEAGELLTIRAGAMVVMSALTSVLVLRRFRYRVPMAVGFAVLASGLLLLSIPPPGTTPWLWLNLACVVCGMGVGIAGPPSNNAVLQLMPEQVAAITGLRAMFRQIGGMLTITVTAAVIAASPVGVHALSAVFATLAVITIIAIPVIRGVPDDLPSERRRAEAPLLR